MGENDVKFIIVFNEENRYILLEQDEFFVFFIYVVKFLGIRLISFMIFIDNNIIRLVDLVFENLVMWVENVRSLFCFNGVCLFFLLKVVVNLILFLFVLFL